MPARATQSGDLHKEETRSRTNEFMGGPGGKKTLEAKLLVLSTNTWDKWNKRQGLPPHTSGTLAPLAEGILS